MDNPGHTEANFALKDLDATSILNCTSAESIAVFDWFLSNMFKKVVPGYCIISQKTCLKLEAQRWSDESDEKSGLPKISTKFKLAKSRTCLVCTLRPALQTSTIQKTLLLHIMPRMKVGVLPRNNKIYQI